MGNGRTFLFLGCLGWLTITACGQTAADAIARPSSAADANASGGSSGQAGAQVPAAQASCKRGLAVSASVSPAFSAHDMAALGANVSWWYNWAYAPSSSAQQAASEAQGLEYVPMIWTAPFDANKISAAIRPGTRHLLTFNEPNFTGQGNLTPAEAASYWPQVEQLANAHNLLIVGPALNYCGGACNETDPMVWLDAFLAACKNCRIDHLAIHAYVCYGAALSGAYLAPFAQKYGKPLWLTEFSCGDGSADGSQPAVQARYLQEALPLLEGNDMVYRYSWFLARSSTPAAIDLLAADGTLTALGQLYVAQPSACAGP